MSDILSGARSLEEGPCSAPLTTEETKIASFDIDYDELSERFQSVMVSAPPEVEEANVLDKETLSKKISEYADAYHNGTEKIDDGLYDLITEIYERRFGPYKIVGASTRCERVSLPHFLGSLNKIKTITELKKWLESLRKRYGIDPTQLNFLYEDKLDGLTLYFKSEKVNGKFVYTLSTRGDGHIGGNVNHAIPDLIRIPLPQFEVEFRVEVIMPKQRFAKYARSPTNPKGFSNPRACVAGAFNSKESYNPAIVRDCEIVGYRLIHAENVKEEMTPSQQLKYLEAMKIETAFATPFPGSLLNDMDALFKWLCDVLIYRKLNSPLEMDGGVIYVDMALPFPDDDNPYHIVAFKPQIATVVKATTVIDLEWRVSKDRIMTPVIHYEKIALYGEYGGVTYLERALVDNAKYVIENGVFPGARIMVKRSGEVIPRVAGVIEPAQPVWPDVSVYGQYDYDGVHLVLRVDSAPVIIRRIVHFFKVLEVDGVKEARAEVIYKAGFNSLQKILSMTVENMASMDRMGTKTATKILTALWASIREAHLARIMAASSCFERGLGYDRLKLIVDTYPYILWMSTDPELVGKIQQIRGFDDMAYQFVKYLPVFISFINECPGLHFIYAKCQAAAAGPAVTSGLPLSCMGITPSGFDNPQFRKEIEKLGATYEDNLTKSRTKLLVILNEDAKSNSKYKKATGWNIPVMTYREFRQKYDLKLQLAGM